jgi:zinc transport system ATP-binding protein
MFAIEIRHLNFAYEKTLILQDVHLSIPAQEIIAVFGPNGGGKTTFLKLLMGFLKPSQGEIYLFQEKPLFSREKIGYVPQTSQLDRKFPLSVLELVLMGALDKRLPWRSYSGTSYKKALLALEKVGLSDKKNSHFGTLSGGQMQRALIARAILNDPPLLFLDEPTANVDSESENAIYRLLFELKQKTKTTVLIVTHQLSHILPKVDRLLCINRQVNFLDPQAVCQHFSLGLYHPPLKQ